MIGHNCFARLQGAGLAKTGRALARAVLLLCAPVLLAALAPAPPDLSGYWKIDGRLAGHHINLMCRFEQHEMALAGPCFGDGTIAKGTASENGASWAWESEGHVLTFEAKLEQGQMTGVIKTPIFPGVNISGAFTAQRPATDQSEANPPQGMDALRNVVRDFAHGKVKAERFTEAPANELQNEIGTLKETYKALGSIHALVFVDRLPETPPDRSTEIYELEFAKGRQVCSVDVAGSKIADLICKSI